MSCFNMFPLVKSFEIPPLERLFDTSKDAISLSDHERFARLYAVIFVIDIKEYLL